MSIPNTACRVGGDEFAVLLPGADARSAAAVVETINELLRINNQFYSSMPLSISCGVATSDAGEPIEAVVKRADAKMYEAKRAHYQSLDRENGAIDAAAKLAS
jgi:diguanylate cyclase (GGDEF)-like protein